MRINLYLCTTISQQHELSRHGRKTIFYRSFVRRAFALFLFCSAITIHFCIKTHTQIKTHIISQFVFEQSPGWARMEAISIYSTLFLLSRFFFGTSVRIRANFEVYYIHQYGKKANVAFWSLFFNERKTGLRNVIGNLS